MTRTKENAATTTTTASRFGASVYRPKSRAFSKETSTTTAKSSSEFTLNDAISPVSSTKNGSSSNADLLADISFDDSRNNISIYESVGSSTNSSFDVHGTPTRYPPSKHVSFDGSNISDPGSPDKVAPNRNNSSSRRNVVTPDRIVSLAPILANDQRVSRMNSVSSASVGDESDATVPTSNLVAEIAIKSFPSKPTASTDETSVSSSVSYDEFGVARNAYESSTATFKNPFEDDVVTPKSSTTNPFDTTTSSKPVEAESTNPFDDNVNTSTPSAAVSSKVGGNSHALTSISEQSNGVKDAPTPEPKKASWMTYLRPLDIPESKEEKDQEEQPVTPVSEPELVVWKPSRPFEEVNMYQDPKEITPVLFMVESKRQCWFEKEMANIRREWLYYKKLIRDNVQEVIRVEDMLRASNDGLSDYVKHIDDMIVDLYVNEEGELLTKRDKTKILKRRNDASTTEENGDTAYDMKDLNLWLNPMIASFSKVQSEIKTQLPLLEECLVDVVSLKQEMRARGKELDEKGNTLSLHVMEQAERNIQESFDALMNVIDELERTQREKMRKAKAAAASNTTSSSSSSDGVLREFVDETKTDEPLPIHDRWLYESQYRHAAKLGLLSWKENRKDYEFWYAEIIALHEERKCRLNEVLSTFLPRRKDLLTKVHLALMSGSDALDETKISAEKESRAIDKAIERNAVMAMKNDATKTAELTMDVILNPKMKGSSGGATKYARSSTDLWKSALIRERRLVELKVNKDEYKTAVCIVTLDDCMHVFVMTDSILNDPTPVASSSSTNSNTNPFESSETAKPLDHYTKLMSTSVTTRIPPIEYSLKLVDYDITIAGGNDDDDQKKSKNPFGSSSSDIKIPTDIELVRKARSVIFRKREDHVTICVPSKKDAIKFLRNRRPIGERLTEI